MEHVGLIQLWLLDTVPTGFLVCDGSSVSQTTYADLYAVIGNMYGTASPGFFKLPDLRGYFPRSYTGAVTVDPNSATRTNRGDGTTGNAVGTLQASMYKAHTHIWWSAAGGGTYGTVGGTWLSANSISYSTIYSEYAGGNESRPKNIYVVPIIKY